MHDKTFAVKNFSWGHVIVVAAIFLWIIKTLGVKYQWRIYIDSCPAHAPPRVQILSFWHTKFWKCNRLGSPRPLLRGPCPSHGKSWIRHWIQSALVNSTTGNSTNMINSIIRPLDTHHWLIMLKAALNSTPT